jgi:hypothetical protein
MKANSFVLSMICPKCGQDLVLSVELIEYLILASKDLEETTDLDELIQQSLRGGKSVEPVRFPNVPMPLAIDRSTQSLLMMGWCATCTKIAVVALTLDDFNKLLKDDEV